MFTFDNTYVRDLHGFFAPVNPAGSPTPRLMKLNRSLATELGVDSDALASPDGLGVLAGNVIPDGATPIAQAYAGHQFGGFNPQLGDGRAILLGEVIDTHGHRRDVQFKGSGRTPFSRGGDGKAALGPVLREYLMGEAMHALRIPTTRALAAVATGEQVRREGLLPGALLTRIAASHLRVGTFQFFAARGETDNVRKLADYAIERHYPHVTTGPTRYVEFLRSVVEAQASLIANWMLVGFIHGVMNTDNMTISGETIDYGPCAFMDAYDPETVFSSIDSNGRYAYGNQPPIGQWNLARLAETLLPLMSEDTGTAVEAATAELQAYVAQYSANWLDGMRAKLGLDTAEDGDEQLANYFLALLQKQQVDYTSAFRALSSGPDAARPLFAIPQPFDAWAERWHDRLDAEPPKPAAERQAAMLATNPIYIARNHLVEAALAAAVNDDDMSPFDKLLDVLAEPFTERPGLTEYAKPAPASFGPYRTYCGT
jgi:serine/tyrosine/threonine adenylyltransferase